MPLRASFLTDRAPSPRLRLRTLLTGWNTLGEWEYYGSDTRIIPFQPWLSQELEPLAVTMPDKLSLALLALVLEDEAGNVLATHSVSAGLDYPAVGPEHALLHDLGRARYSYVRDAEALAAFNLLAQRTALVLRPTFAAQGTSPSRMELVAFTPAGLLSSSVPCQTMLDCTNVLLLVPAN